MSDGLCAALHLLQDTVIQVDCGSNEGGEFAAEAWRRLLDVDLGPSNSGPDTFVLTHPHADHYNGVLHAANSPDFPRLHRLRHLVTAGVPTIPSRTEFVRAVLAMSLRSLGSDTGHMKYDLIRALVRLNGGRRISFRQVFQGDSFSAGATHFKSIWPPREIDDPGFEKPLRKALDLYAKALDNDPVLRGIDERIEGHTLFKCLVTGKFEVPPQVEFDQRDLEEPATSDSDRSREIPSSTKKANKALRDLANQLSLAFKAGSALLMWGDVSKARLPDATRFLSSSGTIDFGCMVAPHHGTYWHTCLQQLRSEITLVSHGPRLASKYRNELATISRAVRSTYLEGDIALLGGVRSEY